MTSIRNIVERFKNPIIIHYLNEGLISEAEYAEQRAKIISAL